MVALDAISEVYRCSGETRIMRHLVNHHEFREYYRAVTVFERRLGELAQETFWITFLRQLKRYRFHHAAAPLPFDWVGEDRQAILKAMRDQLGMVSQVYPDHAKVADGIVGMLEQLSGKRENPLLAVVASLGYGKVGGGIGLLVKEKRLYDAVHEQLETVLGSFEIEVLNQFQMRDIGCFGKLLVIGPARWYPEYIFSAPRAREIHMIGYRWMMDRWERENALAGKHIRSRQRKVEPEPADEVVGQDDHEPVDAVDQAEVDPERESLDAIARLVEAKQGHGESNDEVEAYLFLLGSDEAVPVEADDMSTALVIDVEGEDSDGNPDTPEVRHVKVREIRPGMFLLLRTGGSKEDYLVPVADQILGERAVAIRGKEQQWKDLLAQYVWRNGLLKTSIDLLDEGSKKANETNVRNWMNPRSIRPYADTDFMAILRLVGLDKRYREYFEAADEILRAHRKAGFKVRGWLIDQVRNADMREIMRHGRIDFELPEFPGVSLAAFRVEQVYPEKVIVPDWRLRHVFKVEGEAWQR